MPPTHIVLGCGATWVSQSLLGHLQGSASATETSRHAVDPTDYRQVAAGSRRLRGAGAIASAASGWAFWATGSGEQPDSSGGVGHTDL